MDIHIAPNNLGDSLPQGFSVYQPTLGAQLQFFPAMGTKELDDMLHSFLPGPAPIADKRAAVSVDFLEHLHLTGQTFKFYQVEAPVTVSSASASSSPESVSGASSMSGLPTTPTWDFQSITFTPSPTSSQISTSALRARKSAKAASVSRHQTTDFSHLPGMKIMTRDGIDVTNAASRGSKTKEQRDHAHLMRIIKACDSCRAKKIRCDPSHKRRAAATTSSSATPALPPPSNYRTKRQSTVSKPAQPASSDPQPTPSLPLAPGQDFNWDDFDASMEMIGVEGLDDLTMLRDPWAEFMHFPDRDAYLRDAHISGPEDNFSPLSSLTPTTTSSESVTKPQSPSGIFTSGDTTSSGYVVTNSNSSAGRNHDTWSHELGVEDTDLHSQHSVRSVAVNDGLRRAAPGDSQRIPEHTGPDTTLLSSTDTALSQHRLEDPGTFATNSSSPELSDNVTPSAIAPTSSPLETIPTSSGTIGRSAALSCHSAAGRLLTGTSIAIYDAARIPLRAMPSDEVAEVAPIATQTQGQSLVTIGDGDDHLGLRSVSGSPLHGPAQLMLGGNSELVATPASLSPRMLAEFFTTAALVAIAFVSSVDNLLAHGYPSQGSLDRQPLEPQKAVGPSRYGRCVRTANPMLSMTPMIAGVC